MVETKTKDWESEFLQSGVLWRHSTKDLEQPFALLTSGLISDGYFNAPKALAQPELRKEIAAALFEEVSRSYEKENSQEKISRIGTVHVVGIGSGLPLAKEVASFACDFRLLEVKKDEEKGLVLNTLIKGISHRTYLIVEDVITTGGTITKLFEAIKAQDRQPYVLPYILCICNRTGEDTWNGYRIISLTKSTFETWERGKNPYTEDGNEIVAPVSIKRHSHILSRP